MELNEVGDLVVDDPEALRALADPDRLDLLDRVRRGEPLGAADEPHLEELERLGLVSRQSGRWAPVGKGIFFEIPDEAAGQAAARELTRVMLLREADRPRAWVEDVERKLTLEWARAAGMFNARIKLTADELRDVQEALERVLAPYTTRDPPPAGAAPVRVLAYFLPEPVEPGPQGEPGS
jgi:hypothetical protein